MTSFEKTVKLACKPKAAPPKSKYLDPIIAATWSEDGAVHDVCKALSPRFREPNVIVVFKALIVLHTMIRNGATDNILQYLSSSDVLRLRNVSSGTWEGYAAPENLQNYSKYLDTRIRAYRELKHDAIRVQSETNRDMRNSQAIDEDMDHGGSTRKRGKAAPAPAPTSNLQRSKTTAGRKLRVMTVEKGLLRETKIVQKMVDSLVECRFYLDNLEDELNVTALAMLVKDLLILFQACNEGVINVLEHYFEMSHIDAEEALAIYKHFCKQTERVVEYLGVAKKLQNLLNVPIPNLRHAPVSLASSLEEYLNDPNFEQNRIEYKTQKDAAERNARLGIKAAPKPVESAPPPKQPEASSSSDSGTKTPGQKALIDFFSAIEEEQQTMFNPQTNSPTSNYFQQQAMHNPFQQQMMTGAAFAGAQAFGQQAQLQAQPTGFMYAQHTAVPMMGATNPFGMQSAQQPGQQFQPFLAPQQTGFLQPQMTGANPFRQSTLFPQTTGMPSFGQNMSAPQSNNPFPVQNQRAPPPQQQPQQQQAPPQQQQSSSNPFPNFTQFQPTGMGQQQQAPQPTGQPSFPFSNQFTGMPGASPNQQGGPTIAQPFAQPPSTAGSSSGPVPQRSATAPLTGPAPSFSSGSSGPPAAQPVKTHQTGSRNPFGQPVEPAPPVPPIPKQPTLLDLAMGYGSQNSQQGQQGQQQQQQQPMQTGAFSSSAFGNFGSSSPGAQPSANGAGTNSSIMASVASSFSFSNNDSKPASSQLGSSFASPLTAQPTSSTTSGSTFSDSLFSSLSSQPTGATSLTNSTAPSISVSPAGAAPLRPQTTGFSGLKAFKPSSSFGAALLESLPPIPSNPSSPATSPPASNPGSALGSQPTGFPGLSGQPTGLGTSSLGVGLRPQATGTGPQANPFRASMFSTTGNPIGGAFGGATSGSLLGSTSTPSFGAGGGGLGAGSSPSPFGLNANATGAPSFGGGSFGFGGSFGQNQNQQQQQQQQGGTASLI